MASMFVASKLTPLVVAAILLLGVIAVWLTPREEEPQILVPMVDVMIPYPGATPSEVERYATTPAEKLLWGLADVEYIYSSSLPGFSLITVRYKVGTNHDAAVIRVHHELREYMDRKPDGVHFPLIRSYTIDDVPFLSVTLHSTDLSSYELRRVAADVEKESSEIPDISKVEIIGGEPRAINISPDPAKLAANHMTIAEFFEPLKSGNFGIRAGHTESDPQVTIEAGGFFKDAQEIERLVVGIKSGRVVRIGDVADVSDGPRDIDYSVVYKRKGSPAENAVTLSFSKRPGTNATVLAKNVLSKIDSMKGGVIPAAAEVSVTRNYGETAKEKSDSLLWNLLIAAVLTVVVIALVLGIKYSLIIGVAVPTSLALTLFVYYAFGYTINRVTLFALIMTIGIIVDNAIVVVENIARHLSLREHKEAGRGLVEIILHSIDEVGTPTILATLIIIAALLPMAFVRGLMGPYMSPIPIGASIAMTFSLLIAFIVTPWMTRGSVRRDFEKGKTFPEEEELKRGFFYALYVKIMRALIEDKKSAAIFFATMVLLLIISLGLVFGKAVKVKMLPFDNKSEFQVVIDADSGTPMEKVAAIAGEMGIEIEKLEELSDYQIYAGTASPINFNGLVRHYFMRQKPNLGDIQVNLVHKSKRIRQSHDIAKAIRPALEEIAKRNGVRVKVVEIPPGPPVLSTLVSEVYGPDFDEQIKIASRIKNLYSETPGIVDVDWFVDVPEDKAMIEIDRKVASMKRVPVDRIAQTIMAAMSGYSTGQMHTVESREPVPIIVRLPKDERVDVDRLLDLKVPAEDMSFVALRELVRVNYGKENQSIHHKNLQRVVYVVGDVAGAEESPIYAIGKLKDKIAGIDLPDGAKIEQRSISQPESTDRYSMKWDGEWQISYEVFRDLGIAFVLVMVLIYILVVGWFQSFAVPLVIMSPIPLSLIGVIPGHMTLGAFITATSFIGFIACAGIIVRNSILLIDFVEMRIREGMSAKDAVIDAGVVRFRPILLTAGTVVSGTLVMLFDPIFQGLAISLISGEILAIVLTPIAVPLIYFWFIGDRNK